MLFDIILVVVMILAVVLGFKRGFMRMVLPAVAVALAFYLATTFGSGLAEWFETKTVEPKITASIAEELRQGRTNVTEAIPDYLIANAGRFGLNLEALTIGAVSDETIDAKATELVHSYIHPPLHKALTGITTVVLFLVLSGLLVFLAKRLGKGMNRSILGSFNRVAGGIMGLVNGCVIAAFLCALMLTVISLTTNGFLIFKPEIADASRIYQAVVKIVLP